MRLGFDLYEYDLKSGKLLGTRGIQKWAMADHAQPDLLAFWPVTEPTGVFTSPGVFGSQEGRQDGAHDGADVAGFEIGCAVVLRISSRCRR